MRSLARVAAVLALSACLRLLAADAYPILTPPAPATPRINGASVFGVRPGSPFLYSIAATGDRPMRFAADNLPTGLSLDPATGQITGTVTTRGDARVVLHASNDLGTASRPLLIRVGDAIALTPPLGWNSWNCWGPSVTQEKVLRSARAMVSKGLSQHGWTYVNIDDSWQGLRSGPLGAIQPNEKFPDMQALCAELHGMGLKAGIYSTPWITSYAKFCGGSSDNADGSWARSMANDAHLKFGTISFAAADAKQWARWGFDYLKYDWFPNDIPHVREMSEALRASGRDIVYSLSNAAPFQDAAQLGTWANSWRTTGDMWDRWDESDHDWRYGVSEIGFSQDKWSPYAAPGHWNDPDMLVIGLVGWGPNLHPTKLTADEQYSHISLWCLLSAPLLIGCDIEHMDDFTLNLLTNDEVLAIDQDPLGIQAQRVATVGGIDVYAKPLEDHARAVGFFNRSDVPEKVTFNKLQLLGLKGPVHVRDLWRQRQLPDATGSITLEVPAHGVMLLRLESAG